MKQKIDNLPVHSHSFQNPLQYQYLTIVEYGNNRNTLVLLIQFLDEMAIQRIL